MHLQYIMCFNGPQSDRAEELKAKREAEESARKEHAAALAVRKATVW